MKAERAVWSLSGSFWAECLSVCMPSFGAMFEYKTTFRFPRGELLKLFFTFPRWKWQVEDCFASLGPVAAEDGGLVVVESCRLKGMAAGRLTREDVC